MRKSEAIRIARQMEQHLERQRELAQRVRDAAEDGCPVAQAAWSAIEDESLPHPTTAVESVVRVALER